MVKIPKHQLHLNSLRSSHRLLDVGTALSTKIVELWYSGKDEET